MKVNQNGRSMVEMLGVLAIIGVLSVGAISGYSKAMKKHKLNVHSQGLSMLMQYSLNFTSSYTPEEGTDLKITSFLDKLKVIPDGFKYVANGDKITDNFGATVRLESCTAHPSSHNFGLRYYMSDTNFRFDVCLNLINVAKEYAGQIHYLMVSNPDQPQTNYYGDIGCKNDRVCLSKLTIDDIYEMCKVRSTDNRTTYFSFSWF